MKKDLSLRQCGLAEVGLGGHGWAEGVREEVWGWMCFLFVWFGVMVLKEPLVGVRLNLFNHFVGFIPCQICL